MPVEIGQLVINARVVDKRDNSVSNITSENNASSNNQYQLIERCVAEVLRVLEDRRER